MNNNLLNDNRFYMVFKDDKNKSHKAYHVVNGELVKTPEYEAHLAQYAKHNYTSEDYKNGKRKPIALKVISVISLIFILSYVVVLPLLVEGSFVYSVITTPSHNRTGSAPGQPVSR